MMASIRQDVAMLLLKRLALFWKSVAILDYLNTFQSTSFIVFEKSFSTWKRAVCLFGYPNGKSAE